MSRRPSALPTLVSRTAFRSAISLLLAATTPGVAPAGFLRGDLEGLGSRRTLAIVGSAAVVSAGALAFENPDAEERTLGRGAVDVPADLGNIYGGSWVLASVAGGLAGAGLLAHETQWSRAGSEMARSLVYTGLAVTALKVAVHRTRPNGGAWSFPSGHTAAAFAVAPVLGRRFGWAAAIPACALAASTGLGRMEDRKHFLSDVLFGAGVGTAIGLAVSSDRGPRADAADAAGAGTDLRAVIPKSTLSLGIAPEGLALTARF